MGCVHAFSAMLVPAILAAAGPQIWFCPLDPLFRPQVNYSGSPEYMSLFTADAPWAQAASRVNVFKIYPQWIGSASDSDLQTQFADLNRRGIALALEYGVLTASSQCGSGVEGFGGQNLLNAARRVRQNGGTLRYVAMDEPMYFSTLYTGKNACQWTPDQTAANAAANIKALLAQFPGVQVGEIEPFPVLASNWLSQYRAGIEAFRNAGVSLAFFDADVNWSSPGYLSALAAARKMAEAEGVPFGIIYDGNPTDTSDAQWIQSATAHMVSAELSLGSPDLAIFQSWHAYPKKLLPEADSDSFTWLIDAYFRRRTSLTSSVRGGAIEGILTAADTGQRIGGATISVTVIPEGGKGVPNTYTAAGTIPEGTQAVVFGVRVNEECNCSGSANFWVTSFGFNGITRDFTNGLTGWGLSTPGSPAATAKIEGTSLHVDAHPGQAVQLNSAPVPFTGTGPYAFAVKAQVAPGTSGSGYLALMFIGASSEIAGTRVEIPLTVATIPVGTANTGAAGDFRVPLPAGLPEAFTIQASYAGDGNYWPAESTVSIRQRRHRPR